MEESATIASLVFPELRWIHEETVSGSEEKPSSWRTCRKTKASQVFYYQRRVGVLGTEVVAKFVPQIGGRVAFGEDRCGCVAMDGAVVGCQQHRHTTAFRLP